MNLLTQKHEARFGRVAWFALMFIIGSVDATLAPAVKYSPSLNATRINFETQ